MNGISYVVSTLLFSLMVIAAISMGAHLSSFVNPPSIFVVVFGGGALWLASNGVDGIRTFMRAFHKDASLVVLDEARAVAVSGRRQFYLAGWIGMMIGWMQMLQQMDDLSKVGPAVAVSLLTVFYALLFSALLWNPLAQKFESRGRKLGHAQD